MFSLRCLLIDLERAGHLVRLDDEIDARLEAAEIQRRVYASGGPAVWFTRVKDCRYGMVSNLFGTIERARYLFRHTYENVRRAIELKIDPAALMRNPLRYLSAPFTGWRMRPKYVRSGAVFGQKIQLSDLPAMQSGPTTAARSSRCRRSTPKTRATQGRLAQQPRHVSRAAVRQRLRARTRDRLALSDPSRHRRASRGRSSAANRCG
jgi:hypothetical protein